MTSLPILLPDGYSPVIKAGDTVTIGQTIAKTSGAGEIIINISKMLSVSPDKAKKIVKKNPGDAIQEQDILAIKKGFWGGEKEKLRSNVSGTVIRYERDNGNLVIRTSYTTLTENIVSPVDGVVSLCDNKKITIDTDKNVFMGTKGVGESGEGEIFILEASFAQNTNDSETANIVYYLDSRAVGKIVIGGNLTRDILIKAIGIGAVGIIGTNITDDDLMYITEKKLTTPVLEIDSGIIENVIAWKEKRIYIKGDSQTVILLHT